MNLSEFQAWFDGYCESLDGPPNAKQWKRIKTKVAEITAEPPSYLKLPDLSASMAKAMADPMVMTEKLAEIVGDPRDSVSLEASAGWLFNHVGTMEALEDAA